jgi:Uma2 family endonuclease
MATLTKPLIANLPCDDGEPMDTPWHRAAMELLISVVVWLYRGRSDYFVGGNMFVYYSAEQVRKQSYKGPDFFFVWGVEGAKQRDYWAVWDEDGRYPNVIIELLSPSTAKQDLTTKKDLYEKTFRTPEYYCYNPKTQKLRGWRLSGLEYQEIEANKKGWLWCEQLGLWLGLWEGRYQNERGVFPRFYNKAGRLVPTEAEALAAELARLKGEKKKTQHRKNGPKNGQR